MIGIGSLDRCFTKVNPAFEILLGYSNKEILNKSFLSFIHNNDLKKTENAIFDALSSKQSITISNRYRCKDSSYKWIEWRVKFSSEDEKIYLIGRDISNQKQVQKYLEESKNILTLAGKISFGLIYEWNVATDTLRWFGNVDSVLGYEQGAISNNIQSWLKLIHPDDKHILANAVEKHRTSTTSIDYQYRIQHKNGSYLNWRDYGLPILDESHHPYKWIGICTDITESKEIVDRIKVFKIFAESSTQGMGWATVDGIIRYINPAMAKMFGNQTQYDSIGKNVITSYYPEDEQTRLVNEIFPIILRDGFWSGELIVKNQSGELIPTLNSLFLISDDEDKALYIANVTTDITENKIAEQKLKDAQHQAEKANQAKSEFLSNMSHELRTPMNAIIGFSQLLEFDNEKTLTQQQHNNIKEISKAGKHLLSLINEVLDLSKIESGQLEIVKETILLGDVIADSIQLIAPLAKDRNIDIKLMDNDHIINDVLQFQPVFLSSDYTCLKQIFLNILSNAVKYNRDNGHIVINCKHIKKNNIVCIQISDKGKGITKEQQQKIFKPFERLGLENSNIEGTGIGLVITKKLVEMMGGCISVESVQNEGATFCFEFPYIRVE